MINDTLLIVEDAFLLGGEPKWHLGRIGYRVSGIGEGTIADGNPPRPDVALPVGFDFVYHERFG